MEKHKIIAAKYSEKICYKCLCEKQHIHTYKLNNRYWGSIFDEKKLILQLCDDCCKEDDEELKEWFSEEPKMIQNTENYDYEDNIEEYIRELPIQGQELFENQSAIISYKVPPQIWIDFELGLISGDEFDRIVMNTEEFQNNIQNLNKIKSEIAI